MLCGMLYMIQLQYNTAKNVLYLYLDSPIHKLLLPVDTTTADLLEDDLDTQERATIFEARSPVIAP